MITTIFKKLCGIQKNSIHFYFLKILISISFASTIIITLFWVGSEYFSFRENVAALRTTLLEEKRSTLKHIVDDELRSIAFTRKMMQKEQRERIKARVDEAYLICDTFYKANASSMPAETIKKHLLTTLSSISFLHHNSYYLILSKTGTQLHPLPETAGSQSEFEESASINEVLELVETKDMGYYEYDSKKADKASAKRKVAYFRAYPPLGLILGAGIYYDDADKSIQEYVLAQLASKETEQNSLYFAGDFSGTSLIGETKGSNIYGMTDARGHKIVQEFIQAAKSNGGFVEYAMPPFKGARPELKLSYVTKVPGWEWYFGTGVFAEDIEESISQRESTLKRQLILRLVQALMLFIAVGTFLVFASSRLSKRVKDEFTVFSDFFIESARRSSYIDKTKLSILEFKQLAEVANQMVNATQEAESKIMKTLIEKDILIKEIHHRVKNNLQIISSLIHLQSQHVENKQTLTALRETSDRIHSMGIVHEKLYQSDNLSILKASDYLHTILNELSYSYNIDSKKIKVSIDVANIYLSIETAIPLGLIFNELITNVYKHAFPGLQSGAISISLQRQNRTTTLLVEDTGVGMPKEYITGEKTNLGMELMRGLVHQIQGSLVIEANNGTKVMISFPSA